MKVYVVIPFLCNGVDVNTNDIATFTEYAAAERYARELGIWQYEIVENYVNLIF